MYCNYLKRIIDVGLSVTALILCTPLFLIVSLLLLLTGEHEVFYFQNRIGYKNNYFRICKFATMLKNSSNMGTGSITIRNDPRVTPVGKFLRMTKINEVPQLINVLCGHMSIVGARPLVKADFLKFPEEIQKVIYNDKPGMTGIGSIIFRDEEKWISEAKGDPHEYYKKYIGPYKGELELWYQNNKTFITDLKLMFCTLWTVFVPESQIPYRMFKGLPPAPEVFRKNNKSHLKEEISQFELITSNI